MENRVDPTSRPLYTRTTMILLFGVIIHAAFLLSLRIGYLNPLFDDATYRVGQGADFYAIYQAAQNDQDGLSVYARLVHKVVPYNYPYRYLPFMALTLGKFFLMFPHRTAYAMWIVVQEVLLIINVWLTLGLFEDRTKRYIAAALWFLFSPYYLELYMGQFSFLMASLFFWMIIFWMKKQDLVADSAWIVSLLVKTNSVLFVPVLVKQRRWKPILLAAVVVSAISIPYFIGDVQSLRAFAWNVSEGISAETIVGNQGFAAFIGDGILRIGGLWIQDVQQFFENIDHLNASIQPPILVWTLFIVGMSVWLTMRASVNKTTELFFLWILVYFLIYKHVWEHQYVMLIPVFVFLYRETTKPGSSVPSWLFWTVFALVALPTVFVFINNQSFVILDPEFGWTTTESLLFHAIKPLAVLTLYAALAISLWKSGSYTIVEEQIMERNQLQSIRTHE